MAYYVFRRVLLLVPVLLVISFISFSLVYLSPGEPARLILQRELQGEPSQVQIDQFNHEHGLDKPMLVQYTSWLKKAAVVDFGNSLSTKENVSVIFNQKFYASAKLFIVAQLIALAIALPLGTLVALKPNSRLDNISRAVALAGISLPSFWLGMFLVYIFAVKLHWLPASGYEKPTNIILPALTMGITGAMELMRLTRTSVMEVLWRNFVRTAKAKGLKDGVILTRHVLRNALIPVITALGLRVSHMVGGAVIVEMLFAWPGLGRFLVQAANARDVPVIQGFVFMSALIFVGINLVLDLLYVFLDPRITYTTKGG
ncbi:ABC transporter permease [Desulfosporosinus sp. BICA1-9]|uniref:ABC transporter permease n=1 Tax=Desulfosporosinus sp. BICA1-9 TaxID=1531958 RepID=UPI00054B7C7F|nr:ABC transporter permease [Desulfosporosinus sp. BICA1-9]KJS47166.1 MAG: glutathione ABC transporter permease [Peptococcaceae bacterium BRH_c23]KJS89346.1 MAG: glutathione ABC transporter permease [Desulfosporosinus sp. BICA1-9]